MKILRNGCMNIFLRKIEEKSDLRKMLIFPTNISVTSTKTKDTKNVTNNRNWSSQIYFNGLEIIACFRNKHCFIQIYNWFETFSWQYNFETIWKFFQWWKVGVNDGKCRCWKMFTMENSYGEKLVSLMESWCLWWKVDVDDENVVFKDGNLNRVDRVCHFCEIGIIFTI